MKKIAVIVTVLIILLFLAACSGKAGTPKASVVGTWEYESGGYVYAFNEDVTGSYNAAGTVISLSHRYFNIPRIIF